MKNPLGRSLLSHPAIVIPSTGVFDSISIDSMEGLPNIDGFHFTLTIKDHTSKLIMLEPTKSQNESEAVRVLWKWICTYGPPKKIYSDQGLQFLNEVVSELLKKFCIIHKITTAYYPQTNGAVHK